MTASLACRGPDDLQIRSEGEATFGHTRLAIIDPKGGAQPAAIHPSGQPIMITFGGEIYNFVELRRLLVGRGHTFRTTSDTEVVMLGFLEWGLKLFSLCRGMFAIAVWDGRSDELHLARDPLGIKPLYFHANADCCIFGSEPKSLFAHGAIKPRLGRDGLSELFGLWPYKSPGAAIYDELNEVGPGEIVTWKAGGARRHVYWRLAENINTVDSFSDAVRNISDLLEDTVALQLRADVPVCYAISGGVDSTAIAGLARRRLPAGQSLSTYSVGFDDPHGTFARSAFRPELDEPYVELAVNQLRSKHTHVELSEQEVHLALDRATIARDLPDTGDLDASLLLLFAKIAGDNIRVALVGEGGDEVFGGYPWFREATQPPTVFPWRQYLCMWPGSIREEVRMDLRLEEYVSDSFSDAIHSVPISDAEPSELLGMRQMSYLDLKRFLPGQLERMDRASMANGVEARVPFCDHVLVQYVWQLPMQYKRADPREKHLLREALTGVIGDEIRLRAKASYPTLGGKSHEYFLRRAVADVLQDKHWRLADLLDARAIQEALTGERKVSARPSVWLGRILSLYRWTKIYNPTFDL